MRVLWRHYPWMLGVVLAPLLFGSVTPEGQSIVGALFALSLILLAGERRAGETPLLSPWLRWGATLLLLWPLIPLPLGLVGVLCPSRATLATAFPVELGVVPGWVPLSVSVAATLQRLWELSWVLAAFGLAREAAQAPRFALHFAAFLALGVSAEVGSDVWYRLHGKSSILGLWHISWGTGAGTFANPNHFAHWIYGAVLFLSGGILRGLQPLRTARLGPTGNASRLERPTVGPVKWPGPSSALAVLAVLAVVLAGLAAGVACGSRGGFVALAGGVVAWGGLLACRAGSRSRWPWLAFGSMGVFMLLLSSSAFLVHRFAQLGPANLVHYPKFQIWSQTWPLLWQFPVFGVGWGGFAAAFNLCKTGFAGSTCWHAENEFLELLAEAGIVGFGISALVVGRALSAAWTYVRRERLAEPEFVLGASSALVAFAVGAWFEFVFQITANAVLAAALLGLVLGSREAARCPVVRAPVGQLRWMLNLGLGLALGAAAWAQGLAFWHWHLATRATAPTTISKELRTALRFWPWDATRRIALARLEMKLAAAASPSDRADMAQAARVELNQGISFDPLNWELRLERAWLDLTLSTNAAQALAEAREVCRLNPRQPRIPVLFARLLGTTRPEAARQFLQLMDRSDPQWQREALELMWQLFSEPAQLWSITPDSPAGLMTLGDFARERRLYPLAAQAYGRLTNRVAPSVLCPKLLAVERPDLVVGWLTRSDRTPQLEYLLCQAYRRAGQDEALIGLARDMAARAGVRAQTLDRPPTRGDVPTLKLDWENRPTELVRAQRVADALLALPAQERDLALLHRLTQSFPQDVRLAWCWFVTEAELGSQDGAAEAGLLLAGAIAASL